MKGAGRKKCADLPLSELDQVITCPHSKRCLLKAGINTLAQLRSTTMYVKSNYVTSSDQ